MKRLKHLAIILDGNRRWAKKRGASTAEGHREGYENVKRIGLAALERGIEHFSVFAFSTENWKRSKEEVSHLMGLLVFALTKEIDFYMKHNVRLVVVGSKKGLSKKVVVAIEDAQKKTSKNTAGQFNLCVNYGGRSEIIEGVNTLLEEKIENVTEKQLSKQLWTDQIPDPDLIVRTSGEKRLSGFLTWSGVYSELKFLDVLWPDFSLSDLDECLEDFQARQRRFGE